MDTAMIVDVVGGLLHKLDLPFEKIDVTDGEGFTRVDITSNTASKIIGWHGETLHSIQHLAKSIIRSKENLEKSPFLILDVDHYQKDQEDKVCSIAERKADFVRRTGNRVALPPMSPYMRRVVHLYIASNEQLQDLTTMSSGEGDHRQIVLRLKDESNVKATDEGELSPVMEEDAGLENLDI